MTTAPDGEEGKVSGARGEIKASKEQVARKRCTAAGDGRTDASSDTAAVRAASASTAERKALRGSKCSARPSHDRMGRERPGKLRPASGAAACSNTFDRLGGNSSRLKTRPRKSASASRPNCSTSVWWSKRIVLAAEGAGILNRAHSCKREYLQFRKRAGEHVLDHRDRAVRPHDQAFRAHRAVRRVRRVAVQGGESGDGLTQQLQRGVRVAVGQPPLRLAQQVRHPHAFDRVRQDGQPIAEPLDAPYAREGRMSEEREGRRAFDERCLHLRSGGNLRAEVKRLEAFALGARRGVTASEAVGEGWRVHVIPDGDESSQWMDCKSGTGRGGGTSGGRARV